MSTAVDHRLAKRRHSVSEESARRRLRGLVGLLLLVGLGGFAAWMLYHSSYLAVSEIELGGQVESRAEEILREQGIVDGLPTINVQAGAVEAALLADPWIAAAEVTVTWPGSVTVDVLERVPVGWIDTGERWMLATFDGVVVATAVSPDRSLPIVEMAVDEVVPGGVVGAMPTAALAFLDALPEPWTAETVVFAQGDELLANVSGHTVFLGHSSDMAAKATVLAAMLVEGVPEGAEINVVSPTRPAVKPQALVETSEEIIGESQPKG